MHDVEKWGDCLSGALTLTDYIAGMVGSGFLGIHLLKSSPWQVIDGIHFISVTLTGYKLPAGTPVSADRYATLRGPFSRVVDELGTTYLRGIPQPITPDAVCLLNQAPLASHFVLSSDPLWLDRHRLTDGSQFTRQTLPASGKGISPCSPDPSSKPPMTITMCIAEANRWRSVPRPYA